MLAAVAVLSCAAVLLLRQDAAPKEPLKNPYTSEDFAYVGNFLTCLKGESTAGIDVSSHQGEIDWQQVKAAGIDFAIIRLGYRGYESGLLHEDAYARQNLKEARAAGLRIGGYFFSQAISSEEAREEAELALEILDGMSLDLPLAFDWEYVADSARTGQTDRQTLTAAAEAFCERVKAAGYAPMLYFNRDLADSLLDVTAFEYPYWLAMYSDIMDYPYRLKLWQYTDKGRVPGIEGDVDLNICFES